MTAIFNLNLNFKFCIFGIHPSRPADIDYRLDHLHGHFLHKTVTPICTLFSWTQKMGKQEKSYYKIVNSDVQERSNVKQ